jgi:hypothetical protein
MRQLALVKTGDSPTAWSAWHDEHRRRAPADRHPRQHAHMLEDLGAGLGVTDPVSGEAVVTQKAAVPKKKAAKKAKAKAKPKKRAAKKKK